MGFPRSHHMYSLIQIHTLLQGKKGKKKIKGLNFNSNPSYLQFLSINGPQLAKMKKSIPDMFLP